MVAVDGAPVGGAFPAVKDGRTTASGNAAAAIAYALANGQRLTVRDPGGAVLATISLAGASASLRYIDAEQHRAGTATAIVAKGNRSEEHKSELQSLMRISYAVFCLKKKKK